MAKRYSRTEKYISDWFISLGKNGKLLYYYLNDNCDHAGFYSISFRHIEMYLGLSQEESDLTLKELNNKVLWSDDKSMIWLKDFLDEQSNLPLNFYNNAHKGIIDRIREHRDKFQKNIDLFYCLPCEHRKNKDKTEIKESLKEYFQRNNENLINTI